MATLPLPRAGNEFFFNYVSCFLSILFSWLSSLDVPSQPPSQPRRPARALCEAVPVFTRPLISSPINSASCLIGPPITSHRTGARSVSEAVPNVAANELSGEGLESFEVRQRGGPLPVLCQVIGQPIKQPAE